jgi:hypothetical protein
MNNSFLLVNLEFKNINSAHEILNHLDHNNCTIRKSFLKILVTLLISVAIAEKSFSSLSMLKTWLRGRIV